MKKCLNKRGLHHLLALFRNQRKLILLLFCAFITGFSFGSNFISLGKLKLPPNYFPNRTTTTRYAITPPTSVSMTTDAGYIVDTPTCRIPKFDPRDKSLKGLVQDRIQMFSCGNALTSVVNNRFIINVDSFRFHNISSLNDVKCCLKTISRTNNVKSDNKVSLSKVCTAICNGSSVIDEFIRVQCVVNKSKPIVEFHFTFPPSKLSTPPTKRNKSNAFNVMIIGLDSVSRLNFQRHMQKTRTFLLQTLKSAEMFGFTKIGDNTFPNVAAVLTGKAMKHFRDPKSQRRLKGPFDEYNWVWKLFKSAGYVTLYGEDTCYMTTFNYLMNGFFVQPTDFYLRPFYKAAEETAYKKHGNTKLCLGPKATFEQTLRWGKMFMESPKNRPYFGFIWSNSLTHDFFNLLQLADDYIYEMLVDLHHNGHLKQTILIVLSDHGMRWGPIRHTTIGHYENRLPALYVYLPESFRNSFPSYYRSLQINTRRLTSPFDVHHTLLDVLRYADPTLNVTEDVGVSLFKEVPLNRSCDDAGIASEYCACDEVVHLSVKEAFVRKIAVYIVDAVNNVTSDVRDKCAKLTLKTIHRADELMDVDGRDKRVKKNHFRVAVEVVPSGAKFEATVLYDRKRKAIKSIDGDIIRLNLYGNQSECVDERTYKSFCYCKQ